MEKNKNLVVSVIVVVVVILVGYYLFHQNSASQQPLSDTNSTASNGVENSNTTTTPPTGGTTTSIKTVRVSIKNMAFNPSFLKIKAGTKVIWVNDDTVSHTVTSNSLNMPSSGVLKPGQSFSFTFKTAVGTVEYQCSIHTTMKGTIVVEN